MRELPPPSSTHLLPSLALPLLPPSHENYCLPPDFRLGRVNWPRVRWSADSTQKRDREPETTDRPTTNTNTNTNTTTSSFLAKGTQGRRWIGGNPVERFDLSRFIYIYINVYVCRNIKYEDCNIRIDEKKGEEFVVKVVEIR